MGSRTDRPRPTLPPIPPTQSGGQLTDGEVEHRLDALEKSIQSIRSNQFDLSIKVFTYIFSVTAFLITALGVWSKIEVSMSVKGMKSDVDQTIADAKTQIKDFIGEAKRTPRIEILYDNAPLAGQVIDVPDASKRSPNLLGTFQIKNSGDKTAETISVWILVGRGASLLSGGEYTGEWAVGASTEKGYDSSCRWKSFNISPGEVLNLPQLAVNSLNYGNQFSTNVPAKIAIYYGVDKPAEAQFTLSLK
jgi:cell division protein FtsL